VLEGKTFFLLGQLFGILDKLIKNSFCLTRLIETSISNLVTMSNTSNFRQALREAKSQALIGPNVIPKACPISVAV